MRIDSIELLPRLRSWRKLHYAIVLAMAVFLLVSYYEFGRSLPVSSGGPWTWFWNIFFFEYKNEALGLTMLVPILYAAVTLGWKRALVIMAVLLACITPHILHFAYSSLTIFTSYVFVIIPPILLMSAEIKLVSDAKERLAREERKRQRAEVIRQLLRAQENERKRIAQELHDGVAQSLLIMATAAHNLLAGPAVVDEGVRTDLQSMKQNSLDLVAEIRAICQGLRPNILDNLGLVPAVKSLIYKMREETGVDVELTVSGPVYELGPEERLAVFRLIQEALTNVTKHAAASCARVAFSFDEEGLTVNIEDDGMGFTVEPNMNLFALSGKLGLLGMSERAMAIGAGLEITSAVGAGTNITISVARDGQGTWPPEAGRSEGPAAGHVAPLPPPRFPAETGSAQLSRD